MADYQMPVLFRTAQVVGITSSAFLAGSIATFSFALIPPLELGPAPLLARQWRLGYHIGSSVNPPIAVLGAASFVYLSWAESQSTLGNVFTTANYFYFAAAALVPAIVPYTLIAMKGINGKLFAKAAMFSQEGDVDEKAREISNDEVDGIHEQEFGAWVWRELL
ncbi:hypothetical protein K490DRAFT_60651 [Saccharata proteae CBS 121410]|uniref:Uncharacterized protein n=1 Tax=Saccharata proteae CBS 121410 TaxID=1314787 RepID=A0A9P4HMD8_9PEZI|nr:hypothetical protein K490DRAFT_60651 [Saccharata proteae CBS 121410]